MSDDPLDAYLQELEDASPPAQINEVHPEAFPELGQYAFSNTAWQQYQAWWAEAGLRVIQEALETLDPPPAWGTDYPTYEGTYFSFRPYCWCDGELEGHDVASGGCPPNFVVPSEDLVLTWYKHVGRGLTANVDRRPGSWYTVVRRCLEELGC